MSCARNLICLESLEKRCFLSAGSLDPTFGNGGVVLETAHITPNDMVLQADGKILISDNTQVMRFNADGSPDTSFGTDGAVTPGFWVAGVAVQSDGKIVVGGDERVVSGSSETSDWAVARYNANGTPDTTFGSSTGQVITQPGGIAADASAVGVVVEPDDNIIVGGEQSLDAATWTHGYGAICFNADGSVNTAFGTNGETNSGNENLMLLQGAASMAEAANGDFVLAGGDMEDAPDGPSDIVFSETGAIVSNEGGSQAITNAEFSGVVSRPDGTLVFSMYNNGNNGTANPPDPIAQFGSAITSFVFDPFSDPAQQNPDGVANASDNQVIVIGNGQRGLGLARFTSSGTIDPSFGLGGSVTLTPQMLGFRQALWPTNVAIEANGDIMVTGTLFNGDLFLARVLGGANTLDQERPLANCDPSSTMARGRSHYQFTVQYAAGQTINAATLGNRNILVTGPHGIHVWARLASVSTGGNVVTAVYSVRTDKLANRRGTGKLNIELRPDQVFDNFGNAVAPGLLAQFEAQF